MAADAGKTSKTIRNINVQYCTTTQNGQLTLLQTGRTFFARDTTSIMKLVASAQTPLEVFLHVRMTTLIELKVLLKTKASFSSFSKDQDKKAWNTHFRSNTIVELYKYQLL